jgi:hypothetical protein
MKRIVFVVIFLMGARVAGAQPTEDADKFSAWLPWQAFPSLTWFDGVNDRAFGFEWELTPLLYSFGMNRHISPWYSFIVEPPARFTGSVEATLSLQVFTTKAGASYFGFCGQVMGYVPLVERGEHLTLNLGVGMYRIENRRPVVGIVGLSTLFGFVHFNLKHSPDPNIWITSLEFRFF